MESLKEKNLYTHPVIFMDVFLKKENITSADKKENNMIYVFEDSALSESDPEVFTVKAPNNINHQMATTVILANQDTWKLREIAQDDEYISKTDHNDLAEILPPNLFIFRHEETKKLIPDMDYMPLVDSIFMKDMLYYWSKSGRKDYIELVDEIEDNMDLLINNAIITNIII